MYQRFLSRKFIMALGALIVAVLVILKPSQADKIQSQGKEITALVVALTAALGYNAVEGSLDHKNAGSSNDPPAPTSGAPAAQVAAPAPAPAAPAPAAVVTAGGVK